jgi:2-dehydro-3-deoxygluconokinase
MTKGIIGFGEILLRLSGADGKRLEQPGQLEVHSGGAEANVVASLAQWKHPCHFVSAVPANPLGDRAIGHLRSYGINTNNIYRSGDRLGLYFLEHGASVRPSQVIYDRKNSSFANYDAQKYDWPAILAGKQWFHFSGINAAVSAASLQATRQAVKQAREMGLAVSCDINFRAALWSMEDARLVLPELLNSCDLIISNVDVAAALLNIPVTGSSPGNRMSKVAEALRDQFNPLHIALTQREIISATVNKFQGGLWCEENFYTSKNYQLNIVDRVGSGDAFAAGVIHGLLKPKWPAQKMIDYAVAAGAFKHSVPGDVNVATEEEIMELALTGSTGAIKR